VVVTVSGGDGNDTLDLSGMSDSAYGYTTPNDVETVIGTNYSDTINGRPNAPTTIIGGNGHDNLTGGSMDDRLEGGPGDDSLNGGAGNDVLLAGDGSDTVRPGTGGGIADGGAGTDWLDFVGISAPVEANLATGEGQVGGVPLTINSFMHVIGGNGDDTLVGDGDGNILDGNGGNDTLIGGPGSDNMTGDEGDDILRPGDVGVTPEVVSAGAGTDTIDYQDRTSGITTTITAASHNAERVYGTNYNDSITAASGVQLLDGRDGNDTLTGSTAAETIRGGAGADTIIGGGGADTLEGGAGDDTIRPTDTIAAASISGGDGDDTLDLSADTGGVQGYHAPDDVETVKGSPGPDLIHGSAGTPTTLIGGDGDDVLHGGSADDRLEGGPGDDTLLGKDGDDVLLGQDGADTLVPGTGGGSADGGPGTDELSFSDLSVPVTVDLADDTVEVGGTPLAISGFHNATGGSGDDTLVGDGGRNVLKGGGGDDLILGGAGDDEVHGDDGDDTLRPGPGETPGGDTVRGGAGDDTADYGDLATGATHTGAEDDGVERIIGSEHDDTLTGSAHTQRIEGRGGDDTLTGGPGDQTLEGGDGNDTLNGDGGKDALDGGDGDDVLVLHEGNESADGGEGDDALRFDGASFPVTVDLAAGDGHAESAGWSFTVAGLETVIGGAGDDRLLGDGGANRLAGGGGDDVIDGRGGPDRLAGDAGDDTLVDLVADGEADELDGGTGDDVINAADKDGLDTVACGDGADRADHDTGDASSDCEEGGARPADWAGAVTVDGPAGLQRDRDLTFTFEVDHPQAEERDLQCRLDDRALPACESPIALTGLDDGAHRLEVRFTDPQGDTTSGVADVTVDTTPPTVGLTAPSETADAQAQVTFTASEPGATFECRAGGAGWEACTSPHTVQLAVGDNVVQVRATDEAGNTGPAAQRTIRRLAPPVRLAQPQPQPQPQPQAEPGPISSEICRTDRQLQIASLTLSGNRVRIAARVPEALAGRRLELRDRTRTGRLLGTLTARRAGEISGTVRRPPSGRMVAVQGGRTVSEPLPVVRQITQLQSVRRAGTIRLTGRLASSRTVRARVQVRACAGGWRSARSLKVRRGRLATGVAAGEQVRQVRVVITGAGGRWTSLPLGATGS